MFSIFPLWSISRISPFAAIMSSYIEQERKIYQGFTGNSADILASIVSPSTCGTASDAKEITWAFFCVGWNFLDLALFLQILPRISR